METSLYKVFFKDGSMFKIFCANRIQKRRFWKSVTGMKQISSIDDTENGIHNIEQWEKIINDKK